MKISKFLICVFLFSILSQLSYSEDAANSTKQTLAIPALPPAKAPIKPPVLGTCSEYTDYYIYECIPFTCSLPVPDNPEVSREMTTTGMNGEYCVHNITYKVRHESFNKKDIKIHCMLTQEGRAEAANQFTRYKQGLTGVYKSRATSPRLKKECRF